MKIKISIILISLFFFSCNSPETISEEVEESSTTEIENQDEVLSVDDEMEYDEYNWTQILACNIGIYQDLAIMVLHSYPADENDNAEIEGTYFYLKHQKNLDVKGTEETLYHNIQLTESYKGKESGYMEFNLIQEDADNFWTAKKGSNDIQQFKAKEILSGDPYELTAEINHYNYTYPHEITQYNSDTDEYDPIDVEDVLKTSIINGEYMAFDYNVVRNNYHLGGMSGIAEKNEDGDYVWVGVDGFTLIFIKDSEEINIFEENYFDGYYGGAYVHFDGTLYLEN